jgi:predicted unusual protein kinase regulating ubiquinone biosynthesis (AarF/ABC1/UbiB family)
MSSTPSRGRQRLRTLARVGLSRAVASVRDLFQHEPGAVRPIDEVELAAARTLAEEAMELRGGMAKVAQLMGYGAGPGASGDREARRALGALWDRLPGADFTGVRSVLEAELGSPLESRFSHFELTPIAAASLGQVHRATTSDGRTVAVKVQYPGVAEALADDLSSRQLLGRLVGAAMGGALPEASLERLRQAVLEELDYTREATQLDRFGRAFAGDATIHVPRPVLELSSKRVLTADFLDGKRLADLADSSAEARTRVAETLFRFHYTAALEHGLLNADPNPGNYLVLDEEAGRVGFVDFGCAEQLDEGLVIQDRRLHYAILSGDGETFRHALVSEGLLLSADVLDSDTFRTWEGLLSIPFRKGEPFTWSRGYAKKLARVTSDLVRARGVTLPPSALLLWRQRIGLAAVLGELHPTVDFRRILQELVARLPRPKTRSRGW